MGELSITTGDMAGQPVISTDLGQLLIIGQPDTPLAVHTGMQAVVPSPGTLALLGVAALVARRGRRRRPAG